MTAREVVDLIKKHATSPWNERSTRDRFKAGNPDVEVKGIATTMMVTFDMLKRANAAGLNMVIAHEDTFWNDPDDTKDLTGNALYKLKTEFIEKNGMMAKGELPMWLPTSGPRAGAVLVSSARAVQQGLRFRNLETTVRDTLEWHNKLPAEQRQKLAVGLTPERETELLKQLTAKQG